MQDKTISYYDNNANNFIQSTVSVEFTDVQDRFLELIPEKGYILDFGCGSGRDTKYFLERGYFVDAVDGSSQLCKLAGEYTGIRVKQMFFNDLDCVDTYDGIWACSSILHVCKEELKVVLQKMAMATKEGGYIYTSFKYGEFEGYRNERYFTDFTEATFKAFIEDISQIEIEDYWISEDVRPGRSEEKWLNLILRKSTTD